MPIVRRKQKASSTCCMFSKYIPPKGRKISTGLHDDTSQKKVKIMVKRDTDNLVDSL
jgi:hypothetical protein